jgi:transcriptional regulator with XRE-family HTH domain
MDSNSRDFGLFIDGLRMDRNLSREDLCDGIMSLSQYKRYLRGDTSIPNNRLLQIADKLKFTISEIHKLYQERSNSQLKKIDEIFNLTRQRKFDVAYEKALEMRNEIFVSEFNSLYFDFCFVYIQHKTNLVSDIHVMELYADMINYPDCLENESFNWVELSIIFQMILTSSKFDNYELADFMYQILTRKDQSFSVSRDQTLIPNLYLVLGQIFGRQSKYENVIELVDKGIQHCLKHQTSVALASLFFIKAMAHDALEEKEKAIQSAIKTIMQLHIEENDVKIDEYKKKLSKSLDIDIDEICKF